MLSSSLRAFKYNDRRKTANRGPVVPRHPLGTLGAARGAAGAAGGGRPGRGRGAGAAEKASGFFSFHCSLCESHPLTEDENFDSLVEPVGLRPLRSHSARSRNCLFLHLKALGDLEACPGQARRRNPRSPAGEPRLDR